MAKKDEKVVLEEKKKQLSDLTASFSSKYLDEDYSRVVQKMVNKLARKRQVPFLSGRIEIWAAAVIHAVGMINFLFAKETSPYASVDDIAAFFQTNKNTTSQKSKLIRDMFKMTYYDSEFSTDKNKDRNPFKDIVFINGLPISMSMFK